MRQETVDKFGGWYLAWFLIAIIALGVCTIVIDNSGRKSWNHVGPVPQGMTKLTKSAYLVDSRIGIEASDICKGGDSDTATPDFQSVNVPRLHAVFVQCARSQTWNDHRELSPNFGDGVLRTLQNPAWEIPLGGLLLIFSIAPWTAYIGETRQRRAERKLQRATIQEKKELLTTQWAKGEVDDLEFETKLDRLVREAAR